MSTLEAVMAAELIIRRAVESDVGTLHRMLFQLSDEIGYGASFRADEAGLRQFGFGPHPLFRAILAEEGGAALGAAVYFPEFSTLRGQPGVYLQDLYLVPEARASGLGRRLLGAVVRDAAGWGAVYLRLAAHEGNEGALAFYERLGFQSDPREQPLWVEGPALGELGAVA